MKKAYIIRHAPKDDATGNLTEDGKRKAKELGIKLPKFAVVIASDSARSQETALLLTGIEPIVDTRAGFLMASSAQSDLLNSQAKSNPLGFVGALYEMKELGVGVEAKARELVELINETITNLGQDENALIVTHEITMVPTQQLLNGKQVGLPIKGVPYLGGYIVGEDKKLQTLPKF